MKAKNRKHFVETWHEEFLRIGVLAHSLPNKEALEFLKWKKSLEKYVEIAADHTYGPAGEKVKKDASSTK